MPKNGAPKVIVVQQQQQPKQQKKQKKAQNVPRKKGPPAAIGRFGARPLLDTEFLRCALAPVSHRTSSKGVPDGSSEDTIVFDYTQTINIEERDGQVMFALVPSVIGAIAIQKGAATVTVNSTATATDATVAGQFTGTLDFTVSQTPTNANDWALIPFAQYARGTGWVLGTTTENNAPGINMQNFRVITNKASVSYTGTTLNDSGAVVIARQDIRPGMPMTKLVPELTVLAGQNGMYLPAPPPSAFVDVSQLRDVCMFSARENYDLINIPTKFDWQPWRPNTSIKYNVVDSVAGLDIDYHMFNEAVRVGADPGGHVNQACNPGMGFAPTTFVSYNGLTKGTSITLTHKTCIEFTLAYNSPMAQMAKPGPPASPATLATLHTIARTIPAAVRATDDTVHASGAGGFLKWYGGAMKSIIGSVWSEGGKGLQNMGPAGFAIGSGVRAMGNLALTA